MTTATLPSANTPSKTADMFWTVPEWRPTKLGALSAGLVILLIAAQWVPGVREWYEAVSARGIGILTLVAVMLAAPATVSVWRGYRALQVNTLRTRLVGAGIIGVFLLYVFLALQRNVFQFDVLTLVGTLVLWEEVTYRLVLPAAIAVVLRKVGVRASRAWGLGLVIATVAFAAQPGHLDQLDVPAVLAVLMFAAGGWMLGAPALLGGRISWTLAGHMLWNMEGLGLARPGPGWLWKAVIMGVVAAAAVYTHKLAETELNAPTRKRGSRADV